MMKSLLTGIVTVLFLVAMALPAFAMSHGGHDHGKQDAARHQEHTAETHGESEHTGHGAMADLQVIGEKTVDGVKGVAKVMVYDAETVALINATHHLMIEFTDAGTGTVITTGKVAVKVKGHHGEEKPVELMPMENGFGADLRIDKGHYDLEVGTKLEDGNTRKFKYNYAVR